VSRLVESNHLQLALIPNSFAALLPKDHPVFFFDDIIERLDLSSITSVLDLDEKRGRPAYDRIMMTKLVIYGYSTGIVSSRKIETACRERIDFRHISANRFPKHRSIARFRKRHLKALAELHLQVLRIAEGDGLITMEEVAIDGSKVLANASKHQAMSYERMCKEEKILKQEIRDLKKQRQTGSKTKQKETAEDLKFKSNKLRHIRKWKKALESRVREEGKAAPEPTAQINFTDPESRIMRVESHFEQAFNAQVAVDKRSQIILAAFVTQDRNDKKLLLAMVDIVAQTFGILPSKLLADAGYFSEEQILKLQQKYPTICALVPPNREHDNGKPIATRGPIPKNISTADRMRRKLKTKEGKAAYAHRKTIVEPVFGQIKSASQEFDQFSFRGLEAVQYEWSIACMVHNLLKIYRHRKELQKSQLRLIA
jgi:transposase